MGLKYRDHLPIGQLNYMIVHSLISTPGSVTSYVVERGMNHILLSLTFVHQGWPSNTHIPL